MIAIRPASLHSRQQSPAASQASRHAGQNRTLASRARATRIAIPARVDSSVTRLAAQVDAWGCACLASARQLINACFARGHATACIDPSPTTSHASSRSIRPTAGRCELQTAGARWLVRAGPHGGSTAARLAPPTQIDRWRTNLLVHVTGPTGVGAVRTLRRPAPTVAATGRAIRANPGRAI